MVRTIPRIALLIVVAFPPAVSRGQDTLWSRFYGGEADETVYEHCLAGDGGYVLCGSTDSFGAGGGDVFVVRTDADGDTLWTRTYGGSAREQGWGVDPAPDGGFVIVGETSSFGAGGRDFYIVRIDDSGDTLWTRTYGGSGTEWAEEIHPKLDGGYYLCGTTSSEGAGGHDVCLLVIDDQGDSLWSRTYGGPADDEALSVKQTEDGGFIIGGITQSFGAGNWDAYVIRTSAAGDTLWTQAFGRSSSDGCHEIILAEDGGYLFAGASYGTIVNAFQAWIVKVDSSGVLDWQKRYGGAYLQSAESVKRIEGDGYIVAAATQLQGDGTEEGWLLRLDAAGDTLWTQTYGRGGSDNHDWPESLVIDGEGHYVVAGQSESLGSGENDCWLFKVRENVTGIRESLGAAGRTESGQLLRSVWPNPTSGETTVSFSVPYGQPVRLEMFDTAGRRVATLREGWISAGEQRAIWQPVDSASGIYFVRLVVGGAVFVTRVALVK